MDGHDRYPDKLSPHMQPYQKVAPRFKNLRIPIFLSKTIDFPTLKTQFLQPRELEVDSFTFLPPFPKRKFFKGVVLARKRGRGRNTKKLQNIDFS